MNVYGELTRAQLENLIADPSLSAITAGRIWFRTDLSTVNIDLGGSKDTLAMLGAAQTFSAANTFNSTSAFVGVPTFSTALILAQVSTPSTPASGFNDFYFKSDGNPYTKNSSGTEAEILTRLNAFTSPTIQKFLTTGSTTGYYFNVTSANATVGATYTNNTQTFTVLATIASGTLLFCSSTGAPAGSGTLTKSTGTGDSTITFSSAVAIATYTLPTSPSPLYIKVKMIAGGGGGAGSGTTGAGNGGNGNPSYFGANLIACGGGGGASAGNSTGGTGGTASLGSGPIGLAFAGAQGGGAEVLGAVSTVSTIGGYGAGTPFAGSSAGGTSGGGTGLTGITNSGAGGGGGGTGETSGANSGAGGGAGGYVDAMISSPSATYVYSVGIAGSNGTAGTSGNAGGSGAAGVIEVTEYYQ